jgi:hypothetical protein
MPRTKISEYSATANSNTDVAGVNVDENCAPSGINNAIRAVMGHLKDFQVGTNGDPFNGPHNGTVGATTPASGAFTTLSATGNVTLGDASTDTLNVGNGGLIKDASGNVGVGVTPSAWAFSGQTAFQVKNASFAGYQNRAYVGANNYTNSGGNSIYIASDFATNYVQVSGQHQFYTAASGTAGNAITFTQAMTLSGTDRTDFLIGSTSAVYSQASRGLFELNGASTSLITLKVGGAAKSYWYYDGANVDFAAIGGALRFGSGTNGVERAQIDTSGNLLVGTTNTSQVAGVGLKLKYSATEPAYSVVGSLSTSANSGFVMYSTGAGAYRFYVDYAGTIFATSTSISAISDQTLKTNVRDLETGLSEVLALKPRRFDWINGDATNVAGFVAQEVEEILPELVSNYKYNTDAQGNDIFKKSLKMGDILPTLVKAIQEQQAMIASQSELITSLTARLDAANL